ncbi:hypothetical protein QY890_13160 [Latilactobacillus sakei]
MSWQADKTKQEPTEQPEGTVNPTIDPAQSDHSRTPELPGHSDSTASHSQNVPRSTTSSDRTDRPTSQPTVSDDLKQLRQRATPAREPN